VILRRGGWRTGEDLEAAAARSSAVGYEEMPDDIRWIRSYVTAEDDGTLGTVCIYRARAPRRFTPTPGRPTCR
jgi:Nickel responsive protein SCO4226-like